MTVKHESRGVPVIASLTAASVILAGFCWMSHRRVQGEPRPGRTTSTEPAPEPEVEVTRLAVRAPLELASDGIPIMPANATDPVPTGAVHPHPMTPEHRRIFEENRVIGMLNGAVDVGDVPALRQALAQYTERYPEDVQDVQAGYAVIADCLEHPGVAARATAERWSEEHHGSMVRRFVMRHCLER